MFVSVPTVPILIPSELDRRPVSRAEVVEKDMKNNRINALSILASQMLPEVVLDAQQAAVRRRLAEGPTSPIASFRRGISRALISAAERIGPEAA